MAATATAPAPNEEEIEVNALPYEFAVLPIKSLFVDKDYQRPLTSFVDKIAENFDPALLGCLVASQRTKAKYAVVDGQTRMEGAKRKGVTELPCVVFTGLTQSDEAKMFARLQKERRGMHSFSRFRAALVAGDPEAKSINRLAEEAGYTLGTLKGQHLTAVAALEKVYRWSPELLERTLVILREGWADRHTPSGEILRGMGYYLAHTEGVDDARLASKLGLVTPDALMRRASALREGGGGGSGSVRYMSQAIDGVYRKKV